MHETQAKQLLKEKKLKVTKERLLILDTLMCSKKPLTAEDLYSTHSKDMNESTVYRILDRLAKEKIVYQTDFRDNKTYYEFQEHHHHHITCTSCGRQEHIEVCLPSSIESSFRSKSSWFAGELDHSLEFFGKCNRCA